jgi:hypothetical protein
MLVVNDTGKAWRGFNISIRDDNNIPYFNVSTVTGGTLRHPDRAHIHTDKIIASQLGFDSSVIDQFYYTGIRNPVLQTAHPDIDENRGVYAIHLFSTTDFVIPDQGSWRPFFVNAQNPADVRTNSVLDFHLHDVPDRGDRPAFTVIMQPVPVPEPLSCMLFGLGAGMVLYRCRRHQRTTPCWMP